MLYKTFVHPHAHLWWIQIKLSYEIICLKMRMTVHDSRPACQMIIMDPHDLHDLNWIPKANATLVVQVDLPDNWAFNV